MNVWLVVDNVGIVWKKFGKIFFCDSLLEVVDGEICGKEKKIMKNKIKSFFVLFCV